MNTKFELKIGDTIIYKHNDSNYLQNLVILHDTDGRRPNKECGEYWANNKILLTEITYVCKYMAIEVRKKNAHET